MSTTLYWQEPLDYMNQDKSIGNLKHMMAEYFNIDRNDLQDTKVRREDLQALHGMKIACNCSETREDLQKLINAVEKYGYVTLELY